jgi:hypothetical protein
MLICTSEMGKNYGMPWRPNSAWLMPAANYTYIEQFNDYNMVEIRSVVEQAHEPQIMAKELELLKCVLPDKFVAGCIAAKLPPSWRNFATSLKHQRHELSVDNFISSLDVEEKARAKDNHTGGTEGKSAANMVQKNAHKSKGKNKASQTTNFKKKGQNKEKKDPCWVCIEVGHWAHRFPQPNDLKERLFRRRCFIVPMSTSTMAPRAVPAASSLAPIQQGMEPDFSGVRENSSRADVSVQQPRWARCKGDGIVEEAADIIDVIYLKLIPK